MPLQCMNCSGGFARAAAGEGYTAIQSGANIVTIKIGGLPSSDAVTNALTNAGKILAKI
jgi:hypothetical protein